MTLDNFLVYLSSKENKIIFNDNKATAFTNKITPNLVLNDDYVVALSNIAFSPDYHCIKKFDPSFFIKIHIKTFNAKGLAARTLTTKYLCRVNITGESTFKAIQQLNNDFVSFLKFRNICKRNQKPIFRYKTNDCYITLGKLETTILGESTKLFWEFSSDMATFLGVGIEHTTIPIILNPVKIPRKIECFFVYTDIVQPSHLGGRRIDILDIIPTDITRGKIVPMLHYKDVKQNLIEDISIRITDQNGYDIQFDDDVDVLCVLHFKLK